MATIRSLSKKKIKPTKISGDTDLLRGGYVERNAGRKFLWVTDGEGTIARFLIHQSEDIEEGFVPREALVHVEAGSKFSGDIEEIKIGSTFSHMNPETKEVVEGKPRSKFSRDEPVWKPNEHERRDYPVMCEIWPDRVREPVTIRVDTAKLRQVAMALGEVTVEIEIDPQGGQSAPLLVTNGNGAIVGVLGQGKLK